MADLYEWFSMGLFAENDYGEDQYKMLTKANVSDIVCALELLKEQKAKTTAYRDELTSLINKINYLREFGTCSTKFVGD